MENPDRVTYFAATDSRGKRVPFGLKARDRERHMYIIGKTGMGKSTLLENMAIQDLRNGEGMAFIDPHGSAVEDLLEYIPEHRIKDVVYFAPFDLENPVAFNIMEDVGYDKRHLVVSGLMATFKKIWEDAWSARMEYILTNTLLALLEYPDATLLGVNRMYTDKAYRKKVVDNVKDVVVKDFWLKEFANYGERYTQEATPAIQNKIGQFTGNPLIRNIIGQPKSSFDMREIMDGKKILLINLSKGLVGDTNMRLLGSMLTTRIFLGAMSRANLSPSDLAKAESFYLYVDEFQNFANETFAEILSEARKYHLNLIIAHQYVAQMEEEVQAAVFGNVGTTVSFRVGPLDAELLEKVFTPKFLQEDLVNLGFAQIYLSLMIDGVGSVPFSATTIPHIERPLQTFKAEVIASSQKQFGNPRASIESGILTELASTDGENGPVEPPAKKSNGSKAPMSGGSNQGATGGNGGGSSSSSSTRTSPSPTRENSFTNTSPRPPVSRAPLDRAGERSPERTTDRSREQSSFQDRPTPQTGESTASRTEALQTPPSSERIDDRHIERPQERRPEVRREQSAQGGFVPRNNEAPRHTEPRRINPVALQPAAKTAEDLRAILRGMTSGAQVERQEKGKINPASLKSALADVLKKTEQSPATKNMQSQESTIEPVNAPRAAPVQQSEPITPKNERLSPEPYEVPEETLRALFKERP